MKQKPPVKAEEEIKLAITGFGNHGTGVGKYKDFAVFVPQAIPGEQVSVKINQVKKTYATGQLIQVLKPSPTRVKPACSIFAKCGGCQLQHIDYSAQLNLKRQSVIDAFERIAGISDVIVQPVKGMQEPWAYRNKVQVPISVDRGKLIAGFYEAGSHRIVPLEHCLIQPEESNVIFHTIQKLIKEANIPPYNEQKHAGLLRHVMIRRGTYSGEWMVVFVVNGKHLPNEDKLISHLTNDLPQVTSIILNENRKRTNVILGADNRVLYGEETIHDQIDDLTFSISPHSFFQVNPVQTEILYKQTREYAGLTGSEVVIDAYCGAGTISLYLARYARKVYGVEMVPAAIADAKRNAMLNHIDQVEFVCGKAEKVMGKWFDKGVEPDIIVVDPPRKGCDPALLHAASKMKPKRFIYVSCNPATLARDVALLTKLGFTLQEVQPIDMFPHTSHIETVCLMSRTENMK
ncbi:23S rRNA m(5)U-1939 methyltransferase [Seinonella peptonophila]|uniref:23S rRNA m(5)U-1939 methyltransferase n=1 Tax=Seinonella peptonophila TaxID=112248 RepID=A0A1M4Y5H3_9BACL|nr:23S rRNA (uracil(1939)-C(5))-methyltransferase RlmD [Seinonella peptonophila]SHF01011.1 23S rRNA m(5)U-1939 methyltransferase [Seinonella peptonophila]